MRPVKGSNDRNKAAPASTVTSAKQPVVTASGRPLRLRDEADTHLLGPRVRLRWGAGPKLYQIIVLVMIAPPLIARAIDWSGPNYWLMAAISVVIGLGLILLRR